MSHRCCGPALCPTGQISRLNTPQASCPRLPRFYPSLKNPKEKRRAWSFFAQEGIGRGTEKGCSAEDAQPSLLPHAICISLHLAPAVSSFGTRKFGRHPCPLPGGELGFFLQRQARRASALDGGLLGDSDQAGATRATRHGVARSLAGSGRGQRQVGYSQRVSRRHSVLASPLCLFVLPRSTFIRARRRRRFSDLESGPRRQVYGIPSGDGFRQAISRLQATRIVQPAF